MSQLEKVRSQLKSIITSDCSRAGKEELLYSFLALHQSSLPPFYENHLVKSLEWGPVPDWLEDLIKQDDIENEDEALETGFYFQGAYYFEMQKIDRHFDVFIRPEEAIGSTWLYQGDVNSHKILNVLPSILLASPESLPDFWAIKAGNYFVCDDGNHRIYAAYLLDRPVKVSYFEAYKNIYDTSGNKIL